MSGADLAARQQERLAQEYQRLVTEVDRLFVGLLIGQWLAALVLAAFVSPQAWAGQAPRGISHLPLAVVLGGILSAVPLYLIRIHPGRRSTRVALGVAQVLWSALLVHLTAGRIETHLHLFGSLTLLAFYRDVRVFAPATAVAVLDHLVRQLLWPESIFGVPDPEWWRWIEHAGWILFLNAFLFIHCRRSYREVQASCDRQVRLEAAAEVERQNFELGRDRDAALAASAAKASFLASMSHEIRTPMNAVLGMTSLLAGTDLDRSQQELVGTVQSSGEHLLMLINDILDLSKIEAGKVVLDEHPFDLREGLEVVFDLVDQDRLAPGVELLLEIDPGVPERVVADAGRLRQILVNLVGNAIKFTKAGEIVLRASAEEQEEGAWDLDFQVRDTGVGIPSGRLATLFDPFEQAHKSSGASQGGTGLGLTIARGLARTMGGDLTATSELGTGSTFRARVRVREASASPEPDPQVAGHRVLVVDDNTTNLRILRSYLEGAGIEVRETTDPNQALGWVREGEHYDAAMLDFQMPELDGLELASALRQCDAGVDLPLVMLSSAQTLDRSRLSEVGAEGVFRKPIRRLQLLEKLAEIFAAAPPAAATSEPPTESRSEEGRATPEGQGLRILVAEDNETNRRVIELFLQRLGFGADFVENGHEAVLSVTGGLYDLVLMDIQMPVMDGLTATRLIRELHLDPEPRIVALTADVVGEARQRCLDVGMDGFLEKPIDPQALERAIEDAAARHPSGGR